MGQKRSNGRVWACQMSRKRAVKYWNTARLKLAEGIYILCEEGGAAGIPPTRWALRPLGGAKLLRGGRSKRCRLSITGAACYFATTFHSAFVHLGKMSLSTAGRGGNFPKVASREDSHLLLIVHDLTESTAGRGVPSTVLPYQLRSVGGAAAPMSPNRGHW